MPFKNNTPYHTVGMDRYVANIFFLNKWDDDKFYTISLSLLISKNMIKIKQLNNLDWMIVCVNTHLLKKIYYTILEMCRFVPNDIK